MSNEHAPDTIPDTKRKTLGRLMAAVGAAAFIYFGSVIILTSIDLGLVIPLLGALCLMTAGYIMITRPRMVLSGRARTARNFGYGLLLLWLVSFAAVEGLIINASFASQPAQADYLLVLGAGIRGDQIPPLLKQRVDAALRYLRTYPESRAIVSGGRGPGETITEAEAMKRYLTQHGIEESRVIKEEESTSTFENLKYTKTILQNNGWSGEDRLVIVTSDYHLFRTRMLARRLGINAEGLPCRTFLIDVPYCYVREYLAVVKSWAVDRE